MGKRLFDVTLAVVGLIVSGPILIVGGAIIRLTDGPPVLFCQVRAGLGGRPFRIIKLRTMRTGEGSDAERLTRVGRFLRSTSVDELPELWNVLRGDMSMVGPRPLPVKYLDRYTAREARRHEVRPGITGLAQVSGRNALSWEDRLELDVQYVEHRSLRLDLRILRRTISLVARRHGISAAGEATMAELRPPPRHQG